MKLLQALRIAGTRADEARIRETMRKVNDACNFVADRARAMGTTDILRVRRHTYRAARETFGLPAQLAVLAVSTTCYALRRNRMCVFAPHDAVAYDEDLFAFRCGPDRIAIATLHGRITVPVVHVAYFPARADAVRGQSDLVDRNGRLMFVITIDAPDGVRVPVARELPAEIGVRNAACSEAARELPCTRSAPERVYLRLVRSPRPEDGPMPECLACPRKPGP